MAALIWRILAWWTFFEGGVGYLWFSTYREDQQLLGCSLTVTTTDMELVRQGWRLLQVAGDEKRHGLR